MSRTTTENTAPLEKYKQQAKILRSMLSSDGIMITHSNALDRVARLHGDKDWNVLCARLKSPEPTPGAYGSDLGVWSICDWQMVDDIAPGAPGAIDFGISVDTDGINIGNRNKNGDYRGVKIEIENGAIRVIVDDERYSGAPAKILVSAHGYSPIEVDLEDHLSGHRLEKSYSERVAAQIASGSSVENIDLDRNITDDPEP